MLHDTARSSVAKALPTNDGTEKYGNHNKSQDFVHDYDA